LDELPAELTRERSCERLSLRPFSAAETGALASAMAAATVPQVLVAALHTHTQGNPLYVRELVRHLCEQNTVVIRDGHMVSDVAAPACKIPLLCVNAAMPMDELRLRTLCPQVTLGAGHFPQLEVPEQVNAMIERFLSLSVRP
jgi:hypothetical protein